MNKVLNLKDNLGELHVSKKENGYYNLIRKNNRNKIINVIDHIQFFNSNNECKLIPIDDRILKEIEYKIETNSNYSSYFVFHDTLDKIDDKKIDDLKSGIESQKKSSEKEIESGQQTVTKSKGKYFVWSADDDIISKDFVEKNLLFLENNLDYVGSISPARFENYNFNQKSMGDHTLDDDKPINRSLKSINNLHANARFRSLFRRNSLIKYFSTEKKEFLGIDNLLIFNLENFT
jgi:hypothetical protein